MLIAAFGTVLKPFLRDRFLHLLIVLGIALTLFQPAKILQFPQFVDWDTIVTLLGLLMLTKGVEVSGYFDFVGRKMINAIDNERRLALFLVMAAAVLSTFMTNDVALFIVIPLTITLKKMTSLPVTRLIIFEALAVNAGSLLTPIGNPQNILLWNKSGLSFLHFIGQMAPLAVVLCFLLLARGVLLRIDWPLILVFIVMFIDVRLIVGLPVLQPAFTQIHGLPDYAHYLLSIGLSQVISNVPATILMINYLPSGALLAYAVNAGGFGLAIGSLANLIALRMANDKKIWLRFHYYSFPFLLFSGVAGWFLLALFAK